MSFVRIRRRAAGALVAVLIAATTGSGCFDEPEIEDRWTRVDLDGATILPAGGPAPGAPCSVSVRATITYRAIVTGFSVTELRASSIPPTSVVLGPDADRVLMAASVDSLLARSVTRGRSVRAITGWHHLIQPFDVGFSGTAPAGPDSTGAAQWLYLVSYLGSGEEIELQGGRDSIVVTPFASTTMQILPIGMPVGVGGGMTP